MRVHSILSSLLCFSLFVAAPAAAQQGTIIGAVADETKAALPGVNVTATDQETGRAITSVTNERGEYRLVNVPPGGRWRSCRSRAATGWSCRS